MNINKLVSVYNIVVLSTSQEIFFHGELFRDYILSLNNKSVGLLLLFNMMIRITLL